MSRADESGMAPHVVTPFEVLLHAPRIVDELETGKKVFWIQRGRNLDGVLMPFKFAPLLGEIYLAQDPKLRSRDECTVRGLRWRISALIDRFDHTDYPYYVIKSKQCVAVLSSMRLYV